MAKTGEEVDDHGWHHRTVAKSSGGERSSGVRDAEGAVSSSCPRELTALQLAGLKRNEGNWRSLGAWFCVL
jgi:hypothetical protein